MWRATQLLLKKCCSGASCWQHCVWFDWPKIWTSQSRTNVLRWIYTVSVFRPFLFVFLRFCFSFTKYALFHPHFYVSISALTRQSHTGQKFSEKSFCKGVQLYFEISLLLFIHKIFEQNFHLYITVYLVRIWTYKNANEKAHTFSRRSKNGQKRTKNGYCVNSPLLLDQLASFNLVKSWCKWDCSQHQNLYLI